MAMSYTFAFGSFLPLGLKAISYFSFSCLYSLPLNCFLSHILQIYSNLLYHPLLQPITNSFYLSLHVTNETNNILPHNHRNVYLLISGTVFTF